MKERTIEPAFLDALETDPITTAAKFYAARLTDSAKAVKFLADEFELSLEDAAAQQVGFSDRRLGKNLPNTDSARGRDLRTQLKSIGLYKDTGHESLRGCVTFPLFDDEANITGIYGRRIDRNGKGPQEITIGSGVREELTTNETNHTNERADDVTMEVTESTEKNTEFLAGQRHFTLADFCK